MTYNPNAPIPGQPAAMVVEDGVYLARYSFAVAGELAAFAAARQWIANARQHGQHLDATVEEYDGKGDPAAQMLAALIKVKTEIEAHWTRDELARDHCGMDVALDQVNAAILDAMGGNPPNWLRNECAAPAVTPEPGRYLVTWTVDIFDAASPLEAAQRAFDMIWATDPTQADSAAVFQVQAHGSPAVETVDLGPAEEEDA